MYNNPQSDELDFFHFIKGFHIFQTPCRRGQTLKKCQKNSFPLIYIYNSTKKWPQGKYIVFVCQITYSKSPPYLK